MLFLLALLVSTFVGGAVRLLFSPSQLNMWIRAVLEKEDPPFEMNFERVQLSLARGPLPQLGLVFNQLSISAKDPCVTRTQLKVDELYIPISFSGLFREELKFRTVHANQMDITLQDKVCEAGTLTQTFVSPKAKAQATTSVENQKGSSAPWDLKNELAYVQNFFRHRWVKEIENTRSWLEGIYIAHLNLQSRGERLGSPLMQLMRMERVHLKIPGNGDDTLRLSLTAAVDPALLSGLQLEPLNLNLAVDSKKAELSAYGHYQEGKLEANATFLVEEGTVVSQGQLLHWPAKPLFHLLKEKSLVNLDVRSRLVWLSGHYNAQLPLLTPEKSAVNFDNFRLEGDFGQVKVTKATYQPVNQVWNEPMALQLENVSVDRLLTAIGVSGWQGVVTELGWLSGEVRGPNLKDLKFQGVLEGMKILFSRNRNRTQQNIPQLNLQISFNDNRISGLIEQLKIEGGQANGQISFNFDSHFREGIAQVGLEQLQFSPAVQNLMLGGEMSPFEIYGKARWQDGKFHRWQGHLGMNEAKSDDWSLRGLKLKSEVNNGEVLFGLQIKDLQLMASHAYQKKLRPLYLGHEKLGEILEFTDLALQGKTDGQSGQWYRGRASTKVGSMVLSSQGQWTDQDEVKGEILVDFPTLKLLKWEILGTRSDCQLVPSAQMLKILARTDPNLKIPGHVSPLERLNFFKEFLSQLRWGKQ